MMIFSNGAEYLQACTDVRRHRDGSVACYKPPPAPYRWRCATCNGLFSDSDPFGEDHEGNMHCYGCCHARDLEQLRDRSRPFLGYVNGDGQRFTNWPGRELGRVVASSRYRGGWQGSWIYCYTIRDAHGAYWHGRGPGPGMHLKIRASKGYQR